MPDAMPDAVPGSNLRRRHLLTGSLVAVPLVLVLVAAGVWGTLWWRGHHATDEIHAVTGAPRCTGTGVVQRRDLGHEDFMRPTIPMRQGFTCTVPIKLTNAGSRDVEVAEITIPVAGPGGGAGFRVTHVHGIEPSGDDEIDAVAPLDLTLEPGAVEVIELAAVFRRSGCSSPGATMRVDPRIRLTSSWASRDLTVVDLPLFRGTADTSCGT